MVNMDRRKFIGFAGAAAAVAAMTIDSSRAFGANGVSMEYPWQIGPFARPINARPIVIPNRNANFRDPATDELVHWEYTHTFNPAAIAWKDKLYVFYRAESNIGHGIGRHTSRIGLAMSSDGKHFHTLPHPVLYPKPGRFEKYEYPGGCEDPRIVQREDGTFVLTFTMWNQKVARLGVATSSNLIDWTHRGPAFRTAYNGRFENFWSKSGAIVTNKSGDHIIAARVAGKYWMYWHTDSQIALAHSNDLIDWTPVLDHAGMPLLVLPKSSPGHFDSSLTEPGPPALLTESGIVLFYNGMSDGRILMEPRIPNRQYSAGQALFAGDDPAHLIQRPQRPYFWPREPWEESGQYEYGDTFTEGLAWYRRKWFLFYGAGDTFVGMASTRRG
jgi:predicted GH43/DUF377 family glycosyl hydrolase